MAEALARAAKRRAAHVPIQAGDLVKRRVLKPGLSGATLQVITPYDSYRWGTVVRATDARVLVEYADRTHEWVLKEDIVI